MATNLNIACAVLGCLKPVTGQCGGYNNRFCGRYICSDHRAGNLCPDCAGQKFAEEKFAANLRAAEKIKQETTPMGFGLYRSLTSLVMGLSAFVFVLIGGYLCITSGGDLSCIAGILVMLTMIGGAVWFNDYGYRKSVERNSKRAIKMAEEIEKTNPGFLQFFVEWIGEKSNEDIARLRADATGIGVGAVGGIAEAASCSSKNASEDERLRNAVDDEIRRRGL